MKKTFTLFVLFLLLVTITGCSSVITKTETSETGSGDYFSSSVNSSSDETVVGSDASSSSEQSDDTSSETSEVEDTELDVTSDEDDLGSVI